MGEKTRSVLRVGDAIGITLPADFVRENKLIPGQRVFVLLNRRSLLVTTDRKVAEDLADRLHEKQAEVIKEAAVEEAGEE